MKRKAAYNGDPRRVLIVGMTFEVGGRETFVMDLYRHLDRSKIQFDFLNNDSTRPLAFEDEIRALGGRIFTMPMAREAPLLHYMALRRLFRDNSFAAVYYHANNFIRNADVFRKAKEYGVPLRLLHSHNSANWGDETLLQRMSQKYAAAQGKRCITHRLSCSQAAGEWMFGRDAGFRVVKNGVDTLKFDYSPELRNAVRAREGVGRCVVYGTVGRVTDVKNSLFLVDIFSEIHARQPDSVFWHVGGGPREQQMREKICALGLEDSYFLLGRQSRVADYLNGMDLFLLPSVFEGFPLTLVEAQDSGLHCLVSDCVTTDVNLTGNIRYLPLDRGAAQWAETAIEMASSAGSRCSCRELLIEKGYDSASTAQWFQALILSGGGSDQTEGTA